MEFERQLEIPLRSTGGPGNGRAFDSFCEVLRNEPGVRELTLDRAGQKLFLRYDPRLVSLSRVQMVARRLGVELGHRLERAALRVQGLRCADCLARLETRLYSVPGVIRAVVNPAAESISVEYDTTQADGKSIEERIAADTGYTVEAGPISREQRLEASRQDALERGKMAVLTGICLAAQLIALAGDKLDFLSAPAVLGLYVISYLAGGYYSTIRALQALRGGSLSVDLLMILAAAGAACLSDWAEGAVLLFLFSLSNTLEGFILGRTRRAIEALMDLNPDEAVVRRGGREERVPVDNLRRGDIVIVRPAERIPADGEVALGQTSVDQSAMTGESVAVEKKPGDPVFAGTLNQEGAIEVKVTRLASESTLARIVRLVEEAQSEKAQSHRLTDWFGERYTVAVLGGAGLTFLVPFLAMGESFGAAFYRAMTVLVVASPCAVVISIPAAILSAIACAARHGVLFKGGIHLEQAALIKAVAFDKTGTLTLGRPRLVSIEAISGVSPDEILSLAASAESLSEHPLGEAIVEAAGHKGLKLAEASGLEALIGRGIRARVGGRTIWVGKPALFSSRGMAIPVVLEQAAAKFASTGHTVVFVGDEDRVLGCLVVADTLRTSAREAVERLRRDGIERQVMLTGDHSTVAGSIAGELGLECAAELMPEDKLKFIRELRERHGAVAMVGDGINDAPSLAAANLGISLGGTGTDVALETADIVLMSDDLRHVAFAVELGRQTRRIILQNLVFAFSVMAGLLGVAYFGSLSLPFAVVGHEGSTVLVIFNGLRLLGRKPG